MKSGESSVTPADADSNRDRFLVRRKPEPRLMKTIVEDDNEKLPDASEWTWVRSTKAPDTDASTVIPGVAARDAPRL